MTKGLEHLALLFFACGVPLLIVRLMWSHARIRNPEFRIQYSILEFWVTMLSISPTLIGVLLVFEDDPAWFQGLAMLVAVLHQIAGVFFMYVSARLAPESVRTTPLPLLLIFGSTVGWTIIPFITVSVLLVGIMLVVFCHKLITWLMM